MSGFLFTACLLTLVTVCLGDARTAKADVTVSSADTLVVSPGGSLLQVHQQEVGATRVAERQCPPLPANAQWCQVRLKGLPPYNMAVRATNDVVSWKVCTEGYWEVNDAATFGAPGQAMDIGGNMGYFTFVLAHAGWSVHTFEPMKANQALIDATLCANPHLASRVKIHYHGLGAINQRCQFIMHKNNVGNGITRCTGDTNMWWGKMDDFVGDGTDFQIRKFDEVLQELQIQHLDFVKLDVEGYECEVLKGAPGFLAKYAPRLIRTEAWAHLERCGLQEYLHNFLTNGYILSRDTSCVPETDLTFGDYYACKK